MATVTWGSLQLSLPFQAIFVNKIYVATTVHVGEAFVYMRAYFACSPSCGQWGLLQYNRFQRCAKVRSL